MKIFRHVMMVLVSVFLIAGSSETIRAQLKAGKASPRRASVLCNGITATIVGTNGNDTLIGTSGNDVIHGLAGDDTIKGRGGVDIICGGKGNDTLRGGNGKDKMFGGAGNDKLFGGKGDDELDGGANQDRCDGEAGQNTIKNCEQIQKVTRRHVRVLPPKAVLQKKGNDVAVNLDPIKAFQVRPAINEMNVKVTASPKAFITVKFHKQPVPNGRECDPTYQPYRGTVSGGNVTTFDKTIRHFERNTNYTYEICAKSKGVDYRRTGQKKTLAGGAVRILFDKIFVTDDSDDLSAGDLVFYYRVHDNPYRMQSVTVDTGGSFTPTAFFDVDPGLDSVKIWVRGQDNDCTSFFIKPDNCVGDYGEVKTNLDLKSMTGNIKKFSYTADHHGVGFTVQGTIKLYDPNP